MQRHHEEYYAFMSQLTKSTIKLKVNHSKSDKVMMSFVNSEATPLITTWLLVA